MFKDVPRSIKSHINMSHKNISTIFWVVDAHQSGFVFNKSPFLCKFSAHKYRDPTIRILIKTKLCIVFIMFITVVNNNNNNNVII